MPELVTSRSLPRADFIVSQPLSLMSAMSLLCVSPYFEGLDTWLPETRQRMDPESLEEMALVLGFPGRFQRFTEAVYFTLVAEHPDMTYEAFIDLLYAIPENTVAALIHRALNRSADPPLEDDALAALLADHDALAAHLREADLRVDIDAALALLDDLGQLKQRFIAVVERFWHEVYYEEWEATQPMMQRSAAYHRQQHYRRRFSELFTLVTGRLLPESQKGLAPDKVRFIPSCYIGPYFTFMEHPGGLTIFYNCRITPTSGQREGPGLFPPLKALADETRLEILEILRGEELYAQQIVSRLDISQAAVSRHLNLMVSAGVLRVRQEGGAKFYAINDDTLMHLSSTLRAFIE